jgi:hypothetical protein
LTHFSLQAQNPDELTIVENEQLEVVGDGDGKQMALKFIRKPTFNFLFLPSKR